MNQTFDSWLLFLVLFKGFTSVKGPDCNLTGRCWSWFGDNFYARSCFYVNSSYVRTTDYSLYGDQRSINAVPSDFLDQPVLTKERRRNNKSWVRVLPGKLGGMTCVRNVCAYNDNSKLRDMKHKITLSTLYLYKRTILLSNRRRVIERSNMNKSYKYKPMSLDLTRKRNDFEGIRGEGHSFLDFCLTR